MVVNVTKISQKMKRKSFLSIGWDVKIHIIIIIKKYFNLENLLLDIKKDKKIFILESYLKYMEVSFPET